MRACPPTLRRRVATALLSLVTLAGVGTLSAQADDNPNDDSDLAITKVISDVTGNKITYRIDVTNNGPRPGTQVEITDLLDADHLTAESATVTVGALPSDGCEISNNGHTVVCTIHGEINPTDQPPQNGRDMVVVEIVATVTGTGQVCNQATVTGNHDDPDQSNNTSDPDSACVNITEPPAPPRADLSITKQVDKSMALIGEDVLYTLKVHNGGPDAATNVTVKDDIPPQAAIQEVTTSQGTCTPTPPPPATGTVSCTLGFMANNADATVTIRVRPTVKKFGVANKATVSGDQIDPVSGNNTSNTVTTDFVALNSPGFPSGAFGETINVKTLLGLQVKSGPLASVTLPPGGGGPFTASAAKVNVSGGLLLKDLVRLDLLKATTQGGKTANGHAYVASSADVAMASLVNGLIAVEGLHSECYATSAPTGSRSDANIAKLRIAGVAVKVAAGPNSTVWVPGVGQLILNEQVSSGSGLLQTRSVNALHLKLDGLLAKGDIILAHSDCGIDP
jgi:uncharacterized repeat protein (TIGR01451 family)